MISKMKSEYVLAVIVCCCIFQQQLVDAENRVKRQSGSPPEQPRIVTSGGNLIFQTAANHDISFNSSQGGSVKIDGTNFRDVISKVNDHETSLEALNGISDKVDTNERDVINLQTSVNDRFRTVNDQWRNTSRQVETIQTENGNLGNQIRQLNRTVSNTRQLTRLKNKVNRIQSSLNTVSQKLTFDNCGSGPCHNGGTCIDMYDTFRCLCPYNWQGTTCSEDVNECIIYQGTAQGCHSGATCRNTNGGFSCDCPDGFTGVLCNVRAGACDQGSNSELCGHGTCVDSGATHSCICDDGFKKDNATPARCTQDVNECTQVTKPCHDSVQCINVPGGYFCGPCPTGFTGNGHQCNDINECLVNNGGCSINPLVECTNTLGSRICGACPNGYEKVNGEACVWVGICNNNNGGCSPNAQCIDNPSLPTRSCRCNPGYIGNGEGPNGCVSTGSTPSPDACTPNPCQNGGNCFARGNAYTCACLNGWTGHNCEDDVNECTENICQNGGTCTNFPGNYTCTCPAFATGRNCEDRTYQCGGELTGATGSFRFPPIGHDHYPHDISCAWRIVTVSHKVLSVHFTNFSLESHSSCNFDFLQIHDGATASAPLIGKYCGNDSTQGLQDKTLTTNRNQMYMWFKTDRSISDQGFAFTWRSVDPVCGDDIRNATSGFIESPNYPHSYPNNRTCVWTIRVPPGNSIIMIFSPLDIETHHNCSYDYLELRNGLRATDQVIERYCSTTSPGTVTTSGNELYVKFHSDGSNTGSGFRFAWHAQAEAPNCGGQLNLTDGILISPNFPNHYDHNGDCVWVISVPNSNGRIALNFTDFELESSSTCAYDYIEVHDGTDDTAASFGKLCGTELPGNILSTTSNLYIRFHSDSSVSGMGFRAVWTVACGGSFTDQTGQIVSPYWPDHYPHRKTCTYSLEARENQVIEVTFTDFAVEASGNDDSCRYDNLIAYDGSTTNDEVLRRMCGSTLPTPLISTGNRMLLTFTTDASVADDGFRANYEFRDAGSACGGILTNATGTIVSPGHPNFYPHGVDCLWEIRVSEGFQIRLTFNFLSIEASTTCAYDFVEVSNNRTDNTTSSDSPKTNGTESGKIEPTDVPKNGSSPSNSYGRFCGSTSPPAFTSTSNVLYVRFKTDSSIAHEGFSASYVSFNHSWCGDERTSLPGVITSPNYPGNYPHQRECIWTIVAPDNHQIALNITNFVLESHSSCRYDYLEIRNGGNELSPLVGKFCGTTFTSPIYSHSNRLWIKFKSDVSSSASGFRLWYEDTGEGCGADLTGPSGTFLSPNYPTTYNRNAECYWTITVSEGSSVTLFMVDFDIESHSTCRYDYVEVIEGLHSGRSIAKLCGNVPPQPVHSQGNVMTVKFRSDSSLGGRGFHAAYTSSCRNRVLESRHGVIESPNFPDSYPHNRNCSWVIKAPLGNIVSIRFSHFDFEDDVVGSACRNDYLEIRDGNNPSSDVINRRYCGTNLPPAINSTGNAMYITFRSDASLARNGFRLEYITIGCGGDFTGSTGSFTTPNYPAAYPNNRECIWTITVDVGQKIQLQLSNVSLEFHGNCSYDYLEVLGGPDSSSPSLTKVCGTSRKEYTLTSIGHQMYIRFKTDTSAGGTGFFANYTAIDGGCGGVYTTPNGNIQSPGSPGNYPHNVDCEWNITVADFQTVQLTFKHFDIEDHQNCIYDYVKIYDGLEPNAPEIATLCGLNYTDHVYTSTGRSMRVRMRTDSSTSATGFQASYETACGGRTVVGNEIGVIRSPNFPQNYYPNTNCTWTLMGSQAVDRITLLFTHMDLEESSDASQGLCTHDSVRVLQGDNADAPEHGIYCGTGIPPSITSTSYALTIIFTTDRSVQLTGFSASYSKSTSFCGGNITATHGAFSTPNYPDEYPRNAECEWYLNAAPGNQIQLSFGAFQLEGTSGCARDYVEVRDGRDRTNVLGRYCGDTIPSNLTVASSMYVKFRSDAANSFSGFTAQFSTLTGGDLTSNTGQLASPLYPRQYPHNQDYQWTIIVDIGKKVRIEFDDIDIETGTSCAYDYLQFLDGPMDSGPEEIHKLCGTTPPAPFTSTGNTMSVVFHTDFSATGRGFLFSWSAVDDVITIPGTTLTPPTQPAGCNFELVATENEQNVSTPSWPGNYANRMDCTWTIRASGNVRIQFTMQEMSIEDHSSCAYDSLKIYDGESMVSSQLLANICGRTPPDPVISSAGVMKLRFQTDSSVTRKGFFASYRTACGGVLSEASGVILSPQHPNTYPVNTTCQWAIRVVAGRTIELKVESFNLPSTANCTGDRLRILNGNNANSPQVEGDKWAYCGSQPIAADTVFASASRYMWLEFTSDSTADGSNKNFKLSYTEKSVTCGGNLIIPDDDTFIGSFASPGFGSSGYPHNVDCTWIITAPSNARIQLDFPSFDLEKHSTCDFDYVMIRDGGTENSPLLTKICGADTQPTVRSTSSVIRIRLVTDDSIGRGGFNITYKKDSCGGTLIGTSGTITSPRYPNDYPNNANCEWYLEAPVGHYIGMNFTAFTLSNSLLSDCTGQDTLSVYNRDRFGNMSTLVGDYCGRRAPEEVRTADSKAYIRFTSTNADTFAGFSLSFFASVESCGGQMTTPTGTITSPNYPGYYAHSRDCRWYITAPPGKRVTLTFDDFAIEEQARCLFDYVEVFNGHLERSPKLGRFCGNSTAHVLESTGRNMMVHFASDGSVSNGGFSLSYTTSEDIVCGGVISLSTNDEGDLVTPGYYENITDGGDIILSGEYPPNTQCEWRLQGDSLINSSIVIKFTQNRFKLEHDGECRYDFLKIHEGVSSNGREVGRFCSNLTNSVPTQIAVPGNQMWLAFVSDATIQHEGFNITYKFAACGGILRTENGVITSPNYPNNYDHDTGCAWEIVVEEGQQIELTIQTFELEPHPKCDYDHLLLYNGGSHMSPLLAKLCQDVPANKTYISATNIMRLEFVTDFSQAGRGFYITYRTRTQGCGGSFSSLTGNISTQNYPNPYPNNVECVWDIVLPDGYHVNIQAQGIFDIETGADDTSSCFFDYVQFFNVEVNGDVTELDRKYCGNRAPPPQKSNGNHMRIKFRSDRWTPGTGFNLVWHAGCGGTYTAETGTIFSPGYPNNYQPNLVCDYVIVADPDQYVVLGFDDSNFRIEPGTSCQYDSVSVYEGTVNGTRKGRFCGLTAPQPVATRGSMVVRFKTDGDTADDGFKADYFISDCGGYLNDTSGELKSPTHPVNYHNNLNCTWLIEVSSNMSINLRFEEFDLEASSNGNCAYDYVAVYDGPNIASDKLIGRFCGTVLPDAFTSVANSVTVVFKTDASVTKGGFRIVYTETYGPNQGCGGRINATAAGVIVPVRGSDGNYLNGLNCVWIFTAPDDKVLSINISNIDIEAGGSSCQFDGLEIYDGFSNEDRMLTPTICGGNSMRQFVTASNIVRVRFYTDGSVSGTGFTLNYGAVTPLCGGVLQIASGASPVNISSPGYPNQPDRMPVNCRWTLGAPSQAQIRITILDLSITGDPACDSNFLQLRDQPFFTDDGPRQNLQICNVTTPYVFNSYGNELHVNFKHTLPSSSGYRGFLLSYAIADCNRTFTSLDGRITSPNWPSRYPHALNCFMNIQVPSGNKIALYFNQFSMEYHSQCNYDYLEVFDGSTSNSIGKHCGSNIPDPIVSTTNTLVLNMVTDNSAALTGFDITYVASPTGCGGRLTSTHGIFGSLNITAGQPMTCVWVLDLPVRRRPQLEFTVMDLRQNNTACPNRYVLVRNGDSASSPLMGRFCDGLTPALTAATNKLYVQYTTDGSSSGEAKFSAKYTSADQGSTRFGPTRLDRASGSRSS